MWWTLGNLERDSVATIISRFEDDQAPAYGAAYALSAGELAELYGDPGGQKVYGGPGDLLRLYHTKYCRTEFGQEH